MKKNLLCLLALVLLPSVSWAAAPTVSASFSPSTIYLGDSSTLSWSSTNATSCSLPVFGPGQATSGSRNYPGNSIVTWNTSVTCSGPGGSTTKPVTLNVQQRPAPTVNAYWSPNSVTTGQNARLYWSSTHADSCTIPSISGNKPASGNQNYPITTTSDWNPQITCTGSGGTTSVRAFLNVDPPPPPVINAHWGTNPVYTGDHSRLYWSATNANSCTIPSVSGSKPASGNFNYPITITSNWNPQITCTGPGGTTNKRVFLNVEQRPAPTITASFSPNPAVFGEDAILTWNSTNADDCRIPLFTNDRPANGSHTYPVTGSVVDQWNTSITCTGQGGSTTKQVLLNITNIIEFEWSPQQAELGTPQTLSWTAVNADSCDINGTQYATTGEIQHTAASTGVSSDTIICTNSLGNTISATATRTITEATPEPPTVSAEWSDSTINLGESISLNWSATNVSSCTDDEGVEYVDTASQYYENRTSPWTFTPTQEGPLSLTLTCLGEDGSTVFDEATAEVEPEVVEEPYSGFTEDYVALLSTINSTTIVLTTNTSGIPSAGDIELIWDSSTGSYTPGTLNGSNVGNSSDWQSIAIDLALGDFNIDGVIDVLLKDVDPLISAIPNLVDQMVFANPVSSQPPLAVTSLDEDFQQFFDDIYNWIIDPNYFVDNAPHVSVFDEFSLDINPCSFFSWTYLPSHCDVTEIFDPVTNFVIRYEYYDYSVFSEDALAAVGALYQALENDGLEYQNAQALVDIIEEVLGVDIPIGSQQEECKDAPAFSNNFVQAVPVVAFCAVIATAVIVEVWEAAGDIAIVISESGIFNEGGSATTPAPHSHAEEREAREYQPDPFGDDCSELLFHIGVLRAQIEWRKTDLNPDSSSYLAHVNHIRILQKELDRLEQRYRNICGPLPD